MLRLSFRGWRAARAVLLVGLCLLWLHACGGPKFVTTSKSSSGLNDSGTNNTDASTVTDNSGCRGPEDCDDHTPCTLDVCGTDGQCRHNPKCGANEQCCSDGSCGECCQNSDCNDGVGCTEDRCQLGSCIAIAKDENCPQTGRIQTYCSVTNGCRAREACMPNQAGACDDNDPCTEDACVAGLCDHVGCTQGSICCPGVGCAQCCSDSQCDTDKDPCTVDKCVSGVCQQTALCTGSECCKSSDGTTASCGACCSKDDCNDSVDCTVDACVHGQCTHTPGQCATAGQVCTSTGCETPAQCTSAGGCVTDNPCEKGSCVDGSCKFTGCAATQTCCADGCHECCGNDDCDDGNPCTTDSCNAGTCQHTAATCAICDPTLGCVECNEPSDCNDGSDCTTDTCVNHTCQHTGGACQDKQCCNGKCQACCSSNDCKNQPPPMVDPQPGQGEACGVACVSGECVPEKYCTAVTQHCCTGMCVLIAQLCPTQ